MPENAYPIEASQVLQQLIEKQDGDGDDYLK